LQSSSIFFGCQLENLPEAFSCLLVLHPRKKQVHGPVDEMERGRCFREEEGGQSSGQESQFQTQTAVYVSICLEFMCSMFEKGLRDVVAFVLLEFFSSTTRVYRLPEFEILVVV
jgi:hypothetical protein